MNIGHVSILIAFLASLGAMIAFIRNGRIKLQSKQIGRQKTAVHLYYTSVIVGLIASVILFYALLTHQFQYSYVVGYSSKDLPLIYLISAFWAGQEGTFLLWAVFVGLMGLFFLKKSNSDDDYAMAVVSAFSAFLYLLLLIKSPFEIITPAPLDGRGLNPLLQDPWMAIHPPILFIGYAAATFPFALVISGLARRKYEHWINSSFSWTLFASVSLGAGIIIGGFWAYEVLGWGGYWGWDPVENSSLVPWIVMLASIHGLVVFKAKGSLQRTNMILAIITFILVLYATFLTRSGVLADFSVHSFVDLGINNYLIGSMIVSIALGLGLLATRFSEIKSPKIDASSLNRELLLLLSMFVLGAAALFTFVGMSSPIITGLIGKASQVDISFYNKVNLPVAIAMALLLGITPFMSWMEEKNLTFLKRYSMSFVLTALSCIIAYVAGVTSFTLLLFVGASTFGLISNVIITFRQYRSGWLHIGGPLSHIGVALMLIGIVGSGSFDESNQLILKQGEPQAAFGYNFTFKGVPNPEALKPIMEIEVSDGKSSFTANPKLYFSQINQAVMREPDIKVLPLKDLYISPLELKAEEHQHQHNPMIEITKGETKEMLGYKITFTKFDVGQHAEMGAMSVGAILDIISDGKKHQVVPMLTFGQNNERRPIPAELPTLKGYVDMGMKPHVTLNALSVEEKKILLEFHGFTQPHEELQAAQSLVVDISIKPLMMVVWTGVVLILIGMLIAWRRRTIQKV
ncbi:MAG: cytochrome c biogenesis protein CcsA [Ignavibacteriales bacterium]|nr:cytochrome c biogenesis protein CcsA [Ignavibacteriales bacterium]